MLCRRARSGDEQPAIATPQAAALNGGVINGRVTEMRVRNRLVTLIRKHRLDSDEVKRYAAEFCGTETLRDASRSLVEDFVARVEQWAKDDLDGLRKHLSRYGDQQVAS